MNAFAAVLRTLSLLSLLAVAGVLWLKQETYKEQDVAFLEQQIANGYQILQSEKEAQWKGVGDAKEAFDETFSADERVVNATDEHPLTTAVEDLAEAENVILNNPDYRTSLTDLSKEFGPKAFFWEKKDGQSKGKWVADVDKDKDGFPERLEKLYKTDDGSPEKAPQGVAKTKAVTDLKDAFSTLGKKYDEDAKDENGKPTPGVSLHNRLRTVMGKLYKERKDKFAETQQLRQWLAERDGVLRQEQRNHTDTQDRLSEQTDRANGLEIDLQTTRADLATEKEERQKEKDAAEARQKVDADNIARLNKENQEITEDFETQIQDLQEKHGVAMEQARDEMVLEHKRGYQEGYEFAVKQLGGTLAQNEQNATTEDRNPFDQPVTDTPPERPIPVTANATPEGVKKYGLATHVARIDSRDGILMLPVGQGKGVTQGGIWTVYKDRKPSARIKVQSVEKDFSIAYILPRFGNPSRLRPGDPIHVVPQQEAAQTNF